MSTPTGPAGSAVIGIGNPFRRDEKVVEELKRRKMIQASAPFPNRQQELRDLARRLGLPE